MKEWRMIPVIPSAQDDLDSAQGQGFGVLMFTCCVSSLLSPIVELI